METFLFDDIIIGPIKSRRLGVSLGVNLLPANNKLCNFNCIYCECGWTENSKCVDENAFPEAYDVTNRLIEKIKELNTEGVLVDSITFAGNGEPTLHPQFHQIITDVVLVRDLMLPDTKISVLTNATMLHKEDVVEALKMIDAPIFKLDAGTSKMFNAINKPLGSFSLEKVKSALQKFKSELLIQSIFFKGEYNGQIIDNTTEDELEDWIKHVVDLKPTEVMIYTLDRNTPADQLEPLTRLELKNIASRLAPYHIKTLVA